MSVEVRVVFRDDPENPKTPADRLVSQEEIDRMVGLGRKYADSTREYLGNTAQDDERKYIAGVFGISDTELTDADIALYNLFSSDVGGEKVSKFRMSHQEAAELADLIGHCYVGYVTVND